MYQDRTTATGPSLRPNGYKAQVASKVRKRWCNIFHLVETFSKAFKRTHVTTTSGFASLHEVNDGCLKSPVLQCRSIIWPLSLWPSSSVKQSPGAPQNIWQALVMRIGTSPSLTVGDEMFKMHQMIQVRAYWYTFLRCGLRVPGASSRSGTIARVRVWYTREYKIGRAQGCHQDGYKADPAHPFGSCFKHQKYHSSNNCSHNIQINRQLLLYHYSLIEILFYNMHITSILLEAAMLCSLTTGLV